MTERRPRPEKPAPKLEDLELTRETVQDLTDPAQDAVKGGARFTLQSLLFSCPLTQCCLATAQDPGTCAKQG